MARTKQAARRHKPHNNNRHSNIKKATPNKSNNKAPFKHDHLSDDEIFNTPYDLLTSDVFLRLARKYTNNTIFERFNAAQPNVIRDTNTVSGRVYSAIRIASTASGRSMEDLRAEIDEARHNCGTASNKVVEAEVDTLNSHTDDHVVAATPSVRFSSALGPNLQTHILFLFVGNQREVTTIHSALFPAKTRAILEERAQQNLVQEQPIYMINDLPETFEVYRLFLYTGKIFSNNAQNDQDRADNGRDEAHGDREWMRLAHLFIMGLDLDDEKFRNAVIDALIEKVEDTDRYPTGIATEVYSYTTQGDKLRSIIVDLHVWKGQGTGVRTPHDDASGPMEFVQDVLRGLAEARSDAYDPDVWMPWQVDRCKYHVHEVTSQCERKVSSVTAAVKAEAEATPKATLSSPKSGQLLVRSRSSIGKNAPHKCVACNQTFPSSQSLNSHRQSGSHKENSKAWAAKATQQLGS